MAPSEGSAGYAPIAGAKLVVVATSGFLQSRPGRLDSYRYPFFWFNDPLYVIGALLFAENLFGLHARCGGEYGLTRCVVLSLLGPALGTYAVTETIKSPRSASK